MYQETLDKLLEYIKTNYVYDFSSPTNEFEVIGVGKLEEYLHTLVFK